MSAQSQPRLTPEHYLEIERAAIDVRSEYYNGRMYAMSGSTHPHAIVISNLGRHLGNALAKQPCVVTTSDVRVRVRESGLYTYPDVVVVCGTPRYVDDRDDTVLNPILILEVLSPSTEAYDRGFKSAQYRALESLQEYALVSQSEPRVEIFRRQPSGDWLLSESAGLDAVCKFDCVGCTVAMKDVYDKVTFGGEPAIADRPSPEVL
jgi:Uma2 family endonuclease